MLYSVRQVVVRLPVSNGDLGTRDVGCRLKKSDSKSIFITSHHVCLFNGLVSVVFDVGWCSIKDVDDLCLAFPKVKNMTNAMRSNRTLSTTRSPRSGEVCIGIMHERGCADPKFCIGLNPAYMDPPSFIHVWQKDEIDINPCTE
jgi:hypothetical protein